jgi:hypothetical protein
MGLTIILTLISIAVGGLVTFLVTRWYYERAYRDLEREADELKDYTVMLIKYLDEAGVIEVERDAHGNPTRVRVIEVTHNATAKGVPSHQYEVIRRGEQDDKGKEEGPPPR